MCAIRYPWGITLFCNVQILTAEFSIWKQKTVFYLSWQAVGIQYLFILTTTARPCSQIYFLYTFNSMVWWHIDVGPVQSETVCGHCHCRQVWRHETVFNLKKNLRRAGENTFQRTALSLYILFFSISVSTSISIWLSEIRL